VLRFPQQRPHQDETSPPPTQPPPARDSPQAALFRREGDYWSVSDGTTMVRLKNTKGLRYIAHLLQHPGSEFHVTDLVMLDRPVGATAEPPPRLSAQDVERLGMRTARGSDTGEEMLDAQAKAAYKRRLADLRDQLEEATAFNDIERATQLRQEMDFLAHELARAVGLHGRNRTATSHAERARLNVTRAIKAVVKRIGASNPNLGRYLATTIKTGAFCSYTADPRIRLTWTF
jgi:hypothetical protein